MYVWSTSLSLSLSLRAFTASQSGEIKVWNYNSGQCLRTMKRGLLKGANLLYSHCMSSLCFEQHYTVLMCFVIIYSK